MTGPTGSGKTTTLYSALSEIKSEDIKIVTTEDPIEYQLEGINQIQVHTKVGLTFAACLRAILRHDPDVVLVGEIRDYETAENATQASLTGHMVFSTLHTNDSRGRSCVYAIWGVDPSWSHRRWRGFAQRLVRVLCEECKEPYHPSASEIPEDFPASHRLDPKLKLFRRLAANSVVARAIEVDSAFTNCWLPTRNSAIVDEVDDYGCDQASRDAQRHGDAADGWLEQSIGRDHDDRRGDESHQGRLSIKEEDATRGRSTNE